MTRTIGNFIGASPDNGGVFTTKIYPKYRIITKNMV